VNSYVEADAGVEDAIGVVARPRSKNAAWVPVAAFVLQIVACDSHYTPLTKVYSGLLAALTAFAVARVWVVRPQRVPAIEYALVFQYTTFGLATTAAPSAVGMVGHVPRPDAYELAASLALVSAIAMLAGHALWSLRPARARRPIYMPLLTPAILDAAAGPYVIIASAFIAATVLFPSVNIRLLRVLAIILVFVDIVPLIAARSGRMPRSYSCSSRAARGPHASCRVSFS
jgi:hypothetical protein